MATYFVGPGGDNTKNGLSWANRRLTLTSIETLVAAGDTIYVGPGTYRETLTTSHNGSSGNPITFIGDEGGTLTDGIGGRVRVTGSDNDQTAARANCISCANNFRIFRGFQIDTVSSAGIVISGSNCTVDQCYIAFNPTGVVVSAANFTLQRCKLYLNVSGLSSSAGSNAAMLIQNNILACCPSGQGMIFSATGGVNILANLVAGCSQGIRWNSSPAAGQVNNVNGNLLLTNNTGILAVATTDVAENYNDFFRNGTDRSNVSIGANSKNYTPLLAGPRLTLGIMTLIEGMLDSDSQLASIAGVNVPANDYYGTSRLATSSWGPIQYIAGQRPADIPGRDTQS